ncbi:MAG: ImmA/IrrE family metallo-endopeptidase [Frankiaceae bacterium]|nr:ImmA/IrrE family metallo-endopeptidase [Frankiaceae bacterium]
MSACPAPVKVDDSLTVSGEPSTPVTTPSEAAALFSGQRLRLARETRGLSQRELSDRTSITAAAISQFEKGSSRPSAATVVELSDGLKFPLQFFAAGIAPTSTADLDLDLIDGFGHFRSLRSITAAQRRQALSVTHLVRDITAVLGRDVRLPARDIPWLPIADDDESGAESRAAEVRRAWGVGPGPVPDVLRLLEQHGVVAARHGIETSAVSAFSVPFVEHPVVVLHKHGAKRDRDRFSASHELGHIVMHEPDQALASKTVETQAHRFAAAFLMPADQIAQELPSKPDWQRLVQLKQKWAVSIGALLRRANTLAIMPDTTYAQAMRTMSTRGWRTEEPGDLGAPESPALLTRAAELAGASYSELSRATGWPEDCVEDVLAASADSRPDLAL